MNEVEQLVEEIKQIQVQYKREVGGRRKQWPRSIKERVLRLSSAGLKFREIEGRTGDLLPHSGVLECAETEAKISSIASGRKASRKTCN